MKRIDLKNLQEYIQDKGFIVEKYCYKCNKISYRNKLEAKVTASEMCRKGKGHSYAYACPRGCGFHLTSMKPQNSKCTKVKRKLHSQHLMNHSF